MRTLGALCLRTLPCLLLLFFATNANSQLYADFTSNTQSGCSPLVVQFTNTSTGDAESWFWELGNGNTSTEKDPGAIYINPGTYTISLHIKNNSGEDSITKTNYITVYENPQVDFSAQPNSGCAPLDVKFTDKSIAGSGTINSWIWDFGDGITSTDNNPIHTYTNADTFSITLTVINSYGCRQTLQQPSLIKVGGLITDSFTYSYSNICNPPVSVTFKNESQSTSNLTYKWIFGDGGTSTDKNPVYTYNNAGNFIVQLFVTNESGCIEEHDEVLSIGTAKADFTFSDACAGKPVIFSDNSTPTPLSESWDFGDINNNTDTGAVVQHIYNNEGTFQVTLSADFGGCKDTIKKIIKTGQVITADFTASGKKNTCSYPVDIQFSNATSGANAYQWLFGDGNTSTEENPLHTYKSAGNYSVTLIAYSSNGCPDTIVKNNYIQLGPPQIEGIKDLPIEGCAPKTITFKPQITSGASVVSYQWNFGDSTTSTDSIPVHTYKDPGVYTVSLIVVTDEGCTDTLILPNAVALGSLPKANFSAEPLNTCASTPVQFTDNTKGFVTDWLWLFGDGATSTEQNPTHLYNDTGYMDVSLIVSQYGCYDTLVLNDYIFIKPPVAKFLADSKCDDPFTYNFTDTSIAAQTWFWDFGDSTTSTDKDNKHTYTSKGVFYVSLTVTNAECTNTYRDSVNVVRENPSFNYKSLTSNFCKYDSIHFFATQYDSANIKTFEWDFGDGTTTDASVKNNDVYHFYNNAKTYMPLLIVKDVNNCVDTVDKGIQITIYGPAAAFINKAGDCISSTITFNDKSKTDGLHSITTWIWNYGDSTKPDTLTAAPFIHTYITKGLFDVQLKILDNNGCYDTVTNTSAIDITKPVAAFAAIDTLTCSPNAVQFIDSSDGVSMTYKWDFGDTSFSNNPEPLHRYLNEGFYTVQLSLKDKYGCTDTISKPQYIHIANPVADFLLADSLFLCPPAKINPVNTSINFSALTWDFDDGNTSTEIAPEHYYTSAGNYNLKLIAQGYGNCYDTIAKLFVLKGPFAKLNYNPFTGCSPLNVSFSAKGKNVISYVWDFGDGVTNVSADSNANYTYLKPGKFLPQLVVVDSGGCRVPVVNADTVIVLGVDAKFSATPQPGVCDSALYNFVDSSQALLDNIVSFKWKFGDGDSSAQINPSHYYTNPGPYNTLLNILTENGCISTDTIPIDVAINATPQIFATIPDSACVNAPVSLTAGVINDPTEILSWTWNLDNGLILNVKDTTYSFTTAGPYNVFVTGTSATGCADTIQKITNINPLPAVDAGIDSVICRGKSITLNAKGAATYAWVQDATLSCVNCTSPVANPLYNNTYYVSGISSSGCAAIDSIIIAVKQPADVSIIAPDTICAGSTIQLQASGAELFSWQPASIINNNTDSIASSTPQSTTLFSAIGTDSKGCFNDTASKLVNVFPYPTIQLKDSVVTVSAGSEYKVNATGSNDIILWQWSPLEGLSCSNCAQPIIKPTASQTYKVTARNIAGCTTEKNITITVLCKDQNLFIPNTFSPNGDGMNDYFYPRGKGLFTIKSFKIFSRWGILVFEKNNFSPNQQTYGWDGKYKGNALQPDVYVYLVDVLCDNGTIISSKGNVTLLR